LHFQACVSYNQSKATQTISTQLNAILRQTTRLINTIGMHLSNAPIEATSGQRWWWS